MEGSLAEVILERGDDGLDELIVQVETAECGDSGKLREPSVSLADRRGQFEIACSHAEMQPDLEGRLEEALTECGGQRGCAPILEQRKNTPRQSERCTQHGEASPWVGEQKVDDWRGETQRE